MRLRWAPRALRDLHKALDYIAADNPQAAYGIGQRIQSQALLLRDFPYAGYAGREEGTRELSISGTSYTVIYRIVADNPADRIEILRLWHEKRKWPTV